MSFNKASRLFPQYSENLLRIYFSRPDLMKQFNLYDQSSVIELQRWLEEYGYDEYSIPHEKRYFAKELTSTNQNASVAIFGLTNINSGVNSLASRLKKQVELLGLNAVLVPLNLRNDNRFRCNSKPLIDLPKFPIFALTPSEFLSCQNNLTIEIVDPAKAILYFAWETSRIPKEWVNVVRKVKSIWTVSDYCKGIISEFVSPKKISVLPIPYAGRKKRLVGNDDLLRILKIKKKEYFLFQADYYSCLERKNVLGAIKAYKYSIAKDHNIKLLLHIKNLPRKHLWRDLISNEINRDSTILLLEKDLTEFQNHQLLVHSYALISLHRSEGYGLSIMDAISYGVPTIVSRYSGNLMFCNDLNSILISGREVKVGKNAAKIYKDSQGSWFDADIFDATEKINQLIKSHRLYDSISNEGKKLENLLSSEKISRNLWHLLTEKNTFRFNFK